MADRADPKSPTCRCGCVSVWGVGSQTQGRSLPSRGPPRTQTQPPTTSTSPARLWHTLARDGVPREKNVLALHVAVPDVHRVHVAQALQHLAHQRPHLLACGGGRWGGERCSACASGAAKHRAEPLPARHLARFTAPSPETTGQTPLDPATHPTAGPAGERGRRTLHTPWRCTCPPTG